MSAVLFIFSQKISLVISLEMSSKGINQLKCQTCSLNKLWLGIAFELSVGMF